MMQVLETFLRKPRLGRTSDSTPEVETPATPTPPHANVKPCRASALRLDKLMILVYSLIALVNDAGRPAGRSKRWKQRLTSGRTRQEGRRWRAFSGPPRCCGPRASPCSF